MFSYFRGHLRLTFFKNIYYVLVHLMSIVLPLTVKIVLNLISQSYTRSRIFCGMFFLFRIALKIGLGRFFSIFIVYQWWKIAYSKSYFYNEGQEIFLGEIVIIIIIYFWIWCVIYATRQCVRTWRFIYTKPHHFRSFTLIQVHWLLH